MGEEVEVSEPKLGSVWRHYKGGMYVVVGIAKHSETLETMVAYCRTDSNEVWVRPLQMWHELVDLNGKTVYRFTLQHTDQING